MILAEDLAALEDSSAVALAPRSNSRAPTFAAGAARRAAGRRVSLADPPPLPDRRRSRKKATTPKPARAATPPPTVTTLQSEPFWPARLAPAACWAGGWAPRPAPAPTSEGWRRAQTA